MSQADIVKNTETPATRSSLVADLQALGVEPGMTLMVHASLSRLGYISGGPQAVVQALVDVLGEDGTLMMPTHSSAWSDPANWQNPPVAESWWPILREEMPAFDPQLTPTWMMGAVVECFRTLPGVIRSGHPMVSAAARGPNAKTLIDDHPLDGGLGEGSPQARLYDLDGHILLLGIDHANNTSLHVCEYRADLGLGWIDEASPITLNGKRVWQAHKQLDTREDDFAELGEAFAATGKQHQGTVGAGVGRLMRSRDLIDFGIPWMESNR